MEGKRIFTKNFEKRLKESRELVPKPKTIREWKKKIEKEPLPELKPGMTVKVHQLITELGPKGEKQRIQVFEGIILAHQHGLEAGATITVRKISEGIGVGKIFPLDMPRACPL